MKLFPLVCLLVLGFARMSTFAADSPVADTPTAPATPPPAPLIPNGGFEEGITNWGIFVPDEAKDANCRFDVVSTNPHSGANCVRLQSDDYARFSIGSALLPVQPGEHYHVSVWVRADPAAHVLLKTPGFAIRLYLRQGNGDAEGGHLFIGLGNRVSRNTPPDAVSKTFPTTWTQISAVVEIPPGVDAMGPGLFCWRTKGAIYADDFSIEKVDASTALTPIWQPPVGQESTSAPAGGGETAPITVTDDELLAALNLDAPGMEKVKAAVQAGGKTIDWNAVQSAYLDYRRTTCPVRWSFTPADKPAHPTEKDDPAGDQVLLHHIHNDYHFPMPEFVDMGKDFNWTFDPVPRNSPAYSDEWTYGPVGRTEFWRLLASAYWMTGDEKYAKGWVDSLQDFAAKNPMHYDALPGIPTLWRPLDSAIRISISWPNAYYHFLQSPSFTPQANWLYLKLNYEHAQLLLHDLKPGTRHRHTFSRVHRCLLMAPICDRPPDQ